MVLWRYEKGQTSPGRCSNTIELSDCLHRAIHPKGFLLVVSINVRQNTTPKLASLVTLGQKWSKFVEEFVI